MSNLNRSTGPLTSLKDVQQTLSGELIGHQVYRALADPVDISRDIPLSKNSSVRISNCIYQSSTATDVRLTHLC